MHYKRPGRILFAPFNSHCDSFCTKLEEQIGIETRMLDVHNVLTFKEERNDYMINNNFLTIGLGCNI